MKIIIAPDSFKGCLSAKQAALAMERGIRKAGNQAGIALETIKIPMADGGEGTVEAMIEAVGGTLVETEALNPLGEPIRASYAILPDRTAVIEMAAVSGLNLIEAAKRDPLKTTTFGTGQLIADALAKGCRRIVIGIGGSATNDGGAGMAQALGVKLLDGCEREVGFGGGALQNITRIDITSLHPKILEASFLIASDVKNPLCGPNGASHVYGPQKGATPEMVEVLDCNLAHFASIIRRDLGKDLANEQGAGAAGGLGAGLLAFLNAEMQSGIQIVMDIARFEEQARSSDCIVTGEGATDFQSMFGKVPFGIARAAKKWNKPVLCISGTLGNGHEKLYESGIAALFSIMNKPMALEEAIERGEELLEQATENVFRSIFAIKSV